MNFQTEMMEILKQRLIPELQELKQFRGDVRTELSKINGRLDLVEWQLSEVHADIREMRSFMFTSHMQDRAVTRIKEAQGKYRAKKKG